MEKRDATRKEAIDWCLEKGADFITPVFPPPKGWIWAEDPDGLCLTPIFTNTIDADIYKADVQAN